ncbi:YigZ family protein [bacterium]|nr:YigZ family protein [bacterium]
MQVIKENVTYQEEIKHSKFITLLYRVNDMGEVNYYLKKVRDDYKGATHYCYAFNLLNTSGYSDDKEPKNTAGKPMLFILTSNNIVNILVISVRYFGGIKLGTGGLLKAYTNGLLEAIKKSILLNVVSGYVITCEFSYDNEKKYSYLFKDKNILAKVYQDKCIYTLEVDETFLNSLTNLSSLNITNKVKTLIEDK